VAVPRRKPASVVEPPSPPEGEAEPGDRRTGAQSVARALQVLRTFEAARDQGVTEIAHRTGLTVSTAHRIVQALRADGFVDQDPFTERYRLGLSTAVMGQLALEGLGLSLAQPELDRLAATTGEACNLGVRVGDEVMVVVHVPCRQPLRFEQQVGTRVPLHVSAMGKALLAAAGEVPARLPRFTERSITSRPRLAEEMDEIRARGWALNDQERDVGVRAVAAVVLDQRNRPVAAIAVQAPTVRMDDAAVERLGAAVVRSAARISKRWRTDGPDAAR
jgi:DNA-binding IclR family transcriptional regulator